MDVKRIGVAGAGTVESGASPGCAPPRVPDVASTTADNLRR